MDKKNGLYIAVAALVLLAIVVSAAKVTVDTANGPVTVEGTDSVVMSFLKSFMGSGITGMAIANPATCPSGIVSYWDFNEFLKRIISFWFEFFWSFL